MLAKWWNKISFKVELLLKELQVLWRAATQWRCSKCSKCNKCNRCKVETKSLDLINCIYLSSLSASHKSEPANFILFKFETACTRITSWTTCSRKPRNWFQLSRSNTLLTKQKAEGPWQTGLQLETHSWTPPPGTQVNEGGATPQLIRWRFGLGCQETGEGDSWRTQWTDVHVSSQEREQEETH